MTNEEFKIELENSFNRSKATLAKKEKEYSSGRNRADMAKDANDYTIKQWNEKIGDLRNYTFLLDALVRDIRSTGGHNDEM